MRNTNCNGLVNQLPRIQESSFSKLFYVTTTLVILNR